MNTGGCEVNQSGASPVGRDGKHVEGGSHQRLVTVRMAAGVPPPGDRRKPVENPYENEAVRSGLSCR